MYSDHDNWYGSNLFKLLNQKLPHLSSTQQSFLQSVKVFFFCYENGLPLQLERVLLVYTLTHRSAILVEASAFTISFSPCNIALLPLIYTFVCEFLPLQL